MIVCPTGVSKANAAGMKEVRRHHLIDDNSGTAMRAELASFQQGCWISHVTAVIGPADDIVSDDTPLPTGARQVDINQEYLDYLNNIQIDWGERWRWIVSIETDGDQKHAHFRPSSASDYWQDGPLPARILDNSWGMLLDKEKLSDDTVPHLPFYIEKLIWFGQKNIVVSASNAEEIKITDSSTSTSFSYRDDTNSQVAYLEGFTSHRAPPERFLRKNNSQQTIYVLGQSGLASSTARSDLLSASPLLLYPSDSLPDLNHTGKPSALVLVWNNEQQTDVVPHVAKLTRVAIDWLQRWHKRPEYSDIPVVWIFHNSLSLSTSDSIPDSGNAAAWGIGFTAQIEYHDYELILIDSDVAPDVQSIDTCLSTLPANENQLIFRQGQLHGLQLRRASNDLPAPDSDSWQLIQSHHGRLDALALVPFIPRVLAENSVRIDVRAAGLNFRDVMTALGLYPGVPEPLGGEGAGVVIESGSSVTDLHVGERIYGLFPSAFSTTADGDQDTLSKIPDHLSFAEAAALPIVFMTAMWGLDHIARLQAGQRVLIHAAAGGVGLAAIQIARLRSAEIFVTASPEKWALLSREGIDRQHIASSRNSDFLEQFRVATHGEGVDVVLNCLTGDKIDASFQLLKPDGWFIEIGKTDVRENNEMTTNYPLLRYEAFDLFVAAADKIGMLFKDMAALFASKKLKPLPVQAFDIAKSIDVFRHMAKGWHTGKLVLTNTPAMNKNGTVMITGGTGGIALELAKHLVDNHGIKHLLLVSRSGIRANGAAEAKELMLSRGADDVDIQSCDISDISALSRVIRSIDPTRPLTGIFHLAVVLDDAPLSAIKPTSLQKVLPAKFNAAIYLDQLTRNLDIAEFVLFSSTAGVLGNASQGVYASANRAIDALAISRQRAGFPATSLVWGSWSKVGLAASLDERLQARMRRSAIEPLSPDKGFAMLDECLKHPDSVLYPVKINKTLLTQPTDGFSGAISPLLRGLVANSPQTEVIKNTELGLSRRLADVPPEKREAFVLDVVTSLLAQVLGIDDHCSLLPDRSLNNLGMDSLMAVETRNRLSTICEKKLPVTFIFNHPTPQALASALLKQLEIHSEQQTSPTTEPSDIDKVVTRLEEHLTREIPDKQLIQRLRLAVDRFDEQQQSTQMKASNSSAHNVNVEDLSDDELFKLLDDEL